MKFIGRISELYAGLSEDEAVNRMIVLGEELAGRGKRLVSGSGDYDALYEADPEEIAE